MKKTRKGAKAQSTYHFLLYIIIFFLGCQPSNNLTTEYNNTAALAWGKQRLISTISEIKEDSGALAIQNIIVKIKSDDTELPERAQNTEGYHITVENGKISVTGFDPAGALYGCLELADYIKKMATFLKNSNLLMPLS
jgi:hypothetical protein